MLQYNSLTEVEEDVLVEEEILLDEELADLGIGEHAQLIVYNDDHNTFDWVIQCFVEVLNHSSTQAEQLAMLIHFKGKA
ncbi:MAG: ATP-dependent Clp protease adaptor ClpS, partial [Bacteroidota bacterium]